jgi:DNA-binding NarL/FixJ family response regulator
VTTLLLVDDHDLIRGGLRRAVEAHDDLEVVAEAGSRAEALAAARAASPDVAVIDVNLPDGNGIAVAQELRASFPTMGIVVLTMYDNDEHLFAALQAGASAFVSKGSSTTELVAAVRHAASSPTSFTATNLAGAMQRRMSGGSLQLTDREAQILELLKLGIPVSVIAQRLYISPSTAKTHVAKLYDKLGATNRTQAIMEALRLGLIKTSDDATLA